MKTKIKKLMSKTLLVGPVLGAVLGVGILTGLHGQWSNGKQGFKRSYDKPGDLQEKRRIRWRARQRARGWQ